MTTLSVVIPAYNEEGGIAAIAERVLAIKADLAGAGVDDLELLVVDDGSKDRTAAIAEAIPGVRLIRHPQNRGYGAALKTGFSQARGELIGFLDADGTYPPEYFPSLCVRAMDGSDLVIGSRMAGERSQMPLTRRIGNLLFARLLSVLGRQKVTDTASGMRVFKREVLERFYPLPDGLNLTPVMSTRALHEAISMAEVAIPYSERVGRSKLKVMQDGTVFLRSIIWTALSYNPVRLLGLMGIAGVAFALVVAAGLVMLRLSGVTQLLPWQVAMLFGALVAGVTGISVFALGSTFNYLVSLFYKKPVRQGLFGKPVFTPSLDQHFGWIGLLGLAAGMLLALIALALGLNGWDIERLWLYLLASAMVMLVSVQLVLYWVLMRVLEELSQREGLTQKDLGAG
jgi:glycosyltransferase involved in cell wall biosynthesis